MKETITRDELRAAIAHALKDAPGLPNYKRQALTEYAGNVGAVTFGRYGVPGHNCCPLQTIDNSTMFRELDLDEIHFIISFDGYMRVLTGMTTDTIPVL